VVGIVSIRDSVSTVGKVSIRDRVSTVGIVSKKKTVFPRLA
jgi:hypothetical protein